MNRGNKSLWAEGNTKTAVSEGEPFTFTVFGDSGSGSSEQYELADFDVRFILQTFLFMWVIWFIREARQNSIAENFLNLTKKFFVQRRFILFWEIMT